MEKEKLNEPQLTDLDWLILDALCKEIIGPRHEIIKTDYEQKNNDHEN